MQVYRKETSCIGYPNSSRLLRNNYTADTPLCTIHNQDMMVGTSHFTILEVENYEVSVSLHRRLNLHAYADGAGISYRMPQFRPIAWEPGKQF